MQVDWTDLDLAVRRQLGFEQSPAASRRRALAWLWAGLGTVLLAVMAVYGRDATAHPFEDGLAGHRIRLTVHPDRVEAEVLIEEPVPWVLRDLRMFLAGIEQPTAADQERYTTQRLAEFQTGLQLYVNGERRLWEADPVSGPNGVSEGRFVVYELSLQAPLEAEPADLPIHVLDLNHVDAKVVRYIEIWGTPRTDLRGCSLWSEPGTDWSGRWTAGDRTAEVRLNRRMLSGPVGWWNRLRASDEGPQRVGPEGLSNGQISSLWWILWVVLPVMLGGVFLRIPRLRGMRSEHL